MNHFESGVTDNLGLDKLRPDMRMQAELALRFYSISKESIAREDLSSYVSKWVNYNESQFARDFRMEITMHPELLDEYKENPEQALQKMEELLYAKVEA